MVTDDPWSWEVSDLVAELCGSRRLFQTAGCRPADIPDAAHLAGRLRERNVTGRALLTAYDSNALRQELEIQDIGQRRALVLVISRLRQHSETYKQSVATMGVQAIDLNREPSQQPPSVSAVTSDADGRKRRRMSLVPVPPSTNQVSANRVSANQISAEAALAKSANLPAESSGLWDHLQRWAAADTPDEVIDLTQLDSDEDDLFVAEAVKQEQEDEIDDGEDIDDIQQPQEVPNVQRRGKLTDDQVVEIVNQCIKNYQDAWMVNKGVLKEDEVDYDPLRMWEEAEANGQRQLLVEKYETDVAYYTQRVDTLAAEIMKAPGNNPKEIQLQCGHLEVTVNSMMLARWLSEIYALEAAEESEEEQLHDRSHSPEPSAARSQPHKERGNLSLRHAEIIDLGSPPASYQGEGDMMLLDSPHPQGVHVPDSIEQPGGTPAAPHAADRTTPTRAQVLLGNEPENASIATVRRWTWDDLIGTIDRKRIVSKALVSMNSDDREMIRSRLQTVGKADIVREFPACITMLARRETKVQGVLPRDMPKLVLFTRLFLCWWLCDNYFRVEPAKWNLDALQDHLEGGSIGQDSGTFFDYLNKVMTTTFSPEALLNPEQPSQAEIIEISSDEDEPPAAQRNSAAQRNGPPQRPRDVQQHSPIVLD
jgi:hypothetical protein